MNPAVRASDDDRRRVVSALERHTTAGRLKLHEFDARVVAALEAVTLDDLAVLTHDLPEEPAIADLLSGTGGVRAGNVSVGGGGGGTPPLVIAFALASLTLVLLGVLLAVAR
jgi:hypothetical protein